jgi:hypothetical protein
MMSASTSDHKISKYGCRKTQTFIFMFFASVLVLGLNLLSSRQLEITDLSYPNVP